MLARQRRDLVAGWLFPALAGRGIFVCTSRFDLVPYTALEAARAGLATLVPDTGRVGAAEYLSPGYLFRPEPTELCAAIERTINSAAVATGFAPIARAVAAGTGDDAVAAAYETICARF
jgi:glycosyltransferase involved in cell wall biosynthesis